MSIRLCYVVCAALVLAEAGLQARQLTPLQTPQARMTEVERLTSEGEWGRAGDLLTEIINELTAGERSEEAERLLLVAYERRAMARLQTGDEGSARLDFAALLQINPNHTIAAASPGVATFFADVRKSALGLLDLSIPADATVTLEREDGLTDPGAAAKTIGSGQYWLRPGNYRVTVRRPGHEAVTHAFSATPGSSERRAIALPRTSVALFISTTPAGVRVLVDGELRGVTEAAAGSGPSSMLVIDGLVPRDTPYKIRFEKECFVPAGESFLIESLEVPVGTGGPDPNRVGLDRTYDPVLRPAFGELHIAADQPDAVAWIGGHRRGSTVQPITDVCEGVHDVEVRAPAGTFATKVTIEYGKATRVAAPLVPTFVLIPPATPGASLDTELNTRLVEAFRASRAIRLVSADSNGADSADNADASAIATRFNVQGTAVAVRVPPDPEGNDVELTLTAAGAARGDVVRLRINDRGSVEKLLKRVDGTLPVSQRWIGVDVVDVLRVEGAVVTTVDPNGPAKGVIKPGDVIVGIGPEPVNTAQDLTRVLSLVAGPAVNVRIRDRSDAVPVSVAMRPVLVSVSEPDVLFNEAVVELRARLARLRVEGRTPDQAEVDRIRVNLAVALMAAEGWNEAETLLGSVGAGPENGVSAGTLHYLRGVAARAAGRIPDARAHFERAAADAQASLTERGPLVMYLAKAELRGLSTASR